MAENLSLIRRIICIFALTAVRRASYVQFVAYTQNKSSVTSYSTFQGSVASAPLPMNNSGLGKATYNLMSYTVSCKNCNPRQSEIPFNITHTYAGVSAPLNESIVNPNKD